MPTIELIVKDWNGKRIIPNLTDSIEISSSINKGAETLTFSFLRTRDTNNDFNVNLGYVVILLQKEDGKLDYERFFGNIFNITKNELGVVECIAYDSIRYLKSRDSFGYKNKTATELIKQLCFIWGISTGKIASTGIRMSRIETSKSIYDMMLTSLDYSTIQSGIVYVLYMEGSKLTVKPITEMVSSYYLDSESCEGYSYTQDIGEDSFNSIKLSRLGVSQTTQPYAFLEKKDELNMKTWGGKLQYYNIADPKTMNLMLSIYYKKYDREYRTLFIKNAIGDLSLRAGNSITVNINVNGSEFCRSLIIKSMTHKISNSEHLMDLELEARGSGILDIQTMIKNKGGFIGHTIFGF